MRRDIARQIRDDVAMTCRAWRNTEWYASERELIRSAFMYLRNRLNRGFTIQAALGDLCMDAYRHMDA